jgi:hypothetical protein
MIQELSGLLSELAIPHRARPAYRALLEYGPAALPAIRKGLMHKSREVIALPGNGAPKGFGLIDMLAIAEFLADTAGIDDDILDWIEALPAQLPRYSLRGQGYDAPTPVGRFANLSNTLGDAKGERFADVIDAATGPDVGHCQGDGVSDILDVSVRHAPVGFSFIQQYI